MCFEAHFETPFIYCLSCVHFINHCLFQTSLRLHFAKLIALIVCFYCIHWCLYCIHWYFKISEIPLEQRQFLFQIELKRSLFNLFYNWCSRAISNLEPNYRHRDGHIEINGFVEQRSLQVYFYLLPHLIIYFNWYFRLFVQ